MSDTPRKPITFQRSMPAEHVLLVAKVGLRSGETVLGTEHLKPPGTEYASHEDLLEAGYVSALWRQSAVEAVLEWIDNPENHENGKPPQLSSVADRIPSAIREELLGMVELALAKRDGLQ
jgi:hypothetical protein